MFFMCFPHGFMHFYVFWGSLQAFFDLSELPAALRNPQKNTFLDFWRCPKAGIGCISSYFLKFPPPSPSPATTGRPRCGGAPLVEPRNARNGRPTIGRGEGSTVVVSMEIMGGGVGLRPAGPASAQGRVRLIIIKKRIMETPYGIMGF